jgi:hypothetical protein
MARQFGPDCIRWQEKACRSTKIAGKKAGEETEIVYLCIMEATELFNICKSLAERGPSAEGLRRMHEVLVLACAEGVKGEGGSFGHLFSQVDFVCKRLGIAMTDRTICGMPEHTHDEHCIADCILMCEDDSHVHTDECYRTVWSCGMEEHTHTPECYPDHTADVETPEVWEATLPELSGYPVSDIVRIAESQISYAESTRNVEFVKLDDDSYAQHGYTRYGEFAGDPYCDNWSASFVSFCLQYSGYAENGAPRHTDCELMQMIW